MTFIFQWPIGYLQSHQAIFGVAAGAAGTTGQAMGLLLALTYAA